MELVADVVVKTALPKTAVIVKMCSIQKESLDIIEYDSIDSTNEEAKRLIRSGRNKPLLIISYTQTSGKGRKGRKFYSPKDKGIYFSFAFELKNADIPATIIAASAVVDTLLSLDEVPNSTKELINIKWVNDIRIGERKFSGILSEMIEYNEKKYIIIGIGINLFKDNYPQEISEIATSLFDTDKTKVDKSMLAKKIVDKFFNLYYGNKYINIYKNYCKIIGKEAVHNDFKSKSKVKILDITDKGELILDNGDKKITVSSGEIEL